MTVCRNGLASDLTDVAVVYDQPGEIVCSVRAVGIGEIRFVRRRRSFHTRHTLSTVVKEPNACDWQA